MRENVANIDHLPAVLDRGDKPVFVTTNIEHSEKIHGVGVPEILAHIHKTLPLGSFGDQIPVHQGLQSVRVIPCEFGNGRLTDDPHVRKVTKTVTARQRAKVAPKVPWLDKIRVP